MIQRLITKQSLKLRTLNKPISYKLSTTPTTSLPPLSFDFDPCHISGALSPMSSEVPTDIFTKLSVISPTSIYHGLNELFEVIISDVGTSCGVGWTILMVTVGIKLVYAPLMIKTNINTLKLKLLEPETQLFQQNMKRSQAKQDMAGVRQLQTKFKQLRLKHGINMSIMALNLSQFPILITWFLSLRYFTSLPEKYIGFKTDGFLWFQDLSVPDPYCILPVISALLSYQNITVAQSMQASNNIQIVQQFQQIIKYVPFFSIPIVVFFPSGLALYWCLMAATQLATIAVVRNQRFKQWAGVNEFLPGTILETQSKNQQAQVVRAIISENLGKEKRDESNDPMKVQVFTQKPKKKQ